MNIILFLLVALMAAIAVAQIFRLAREECHNAAKPKDEPPPHRTDADKPKPGPSIEEKATKEVADLKPVAAPEGVSEKEVAEKVRAGLTRAQAIEVIERQAEHDAALAKAAKKGG